MAQKIDILNGGIVKKIIAFTIPIMLQGILQNLYNSADLVIVGQFAGDNALSSVGATTTIFGVMLSLFLGITTGVDVISSLFFGKGDYANLEVVTSLSGDPEYYAIGFKKGSELTEKVNKALEELAAEGLIDTIASRYNLVTAITDFSDPEEI
jgi:hypothetical protein